jgi:anaerobic selenocysteine-containing dehydrogenase
MKNKQIDRRDFMKGTAMATGGVMMAGLPVGASAFVNPKAKETEISFSRMRWKRNRSCCSSSYCRSRY